MKLLETLSSSVSISSITIVFVIVTLGTNGFLSSVGTGLQLFMCRFNLIGPGKVFEHNGPVLALHVLVLFN